MPYKTRVIFNMIDLRLERQCSKYEVCDVNACPLHYRYAELAPPPNDLERKCRQSKNKRLKITSPHTNYLKFNGLTMAENRATLAYQSRLKNGNISFNFGKSIDKYIIK